MGAEMICEHDSGEDGQGEEGKKEEQRSNGLQQRNPTGKQPKGDSKKQQGWISPTTVQKRSVWTSPKYDELAEVS